jgi:hypothetical protein
MVRESERGIRTPPVARVGARANRRPGGYWTKTQSGNGAGSRAVLARHLETERARRESPDPVRKDSPDKGHRGE